MQQRVQQRHYSPHPIAAERLGNLAIADGSPLIFVGLLGFAAWLVWLLATGVRLVRS